MKNRNQIQIGNLVPLAVLVLLASCAGNPTRKDCESKDYYQMGLDDGKDGRTEEKYQNLAVACSQAGVPSDRAKYVYGRRVGLAQFCTADRAKKDVDGNKVDSICVVEHVPPYETAYHQELSRRRQQAQADLQDTEKSQYKLNAKKNGLQSQLNQMDSLDSATQTK